MEGEGLLACGNTTAPDRDQDAIPTQRRGQGKTQKLEKLVFIKLVLHSPLPPYV
jgi:hypothetical protein